MALQPLAGLVKRVSRRPVEVVLLPTPDALAKAVCDGEVDVAMTNLGAFVQLRECPQIQAIAVLDTPPAVLDGYRGVLLARRDLGVTGLAGLAPRAAGLRYSEVLPGSTSGALVQAEALRALRLAPTSFASRRHAGTHEGALADLLDGRADVAAMAEEPWRKLQAADPAKAAQIRLLWRSEPLPPGPVICRQSATLSCKGIRSALLAASGREVATGLSAGWTETEGARRFRSYAAKDYRAFRKN
jgi:ABC-type phosphate/phosphonate transport system substrate-binding protein